MAKELAIILNNGSVNSAVVTALAAQKYRPILLHAETAQQSGGRARAAYDQQVAHFKPYREHTLAMPYFAGMGTDSAQRAAASDPRHSVPVAPQVMELLPVVAAAIRFAAHYNAQAIYVGLRVGSLGEELAPATEYVQIWNEMIGTPCALPELEIQAPLLELDPWQVVDLGYQVAAPFDRTWSCLEESGDPCWACRGCRSRELAFQQAAKPDPLKVMAKTAK
jgi:7-cyano-7-deazaguanine synthase in queuosine biosynthesis